MIPLRSVNLKTTGTKPVRQAVILVLFCVGLSVLALMSWEIPSGHHGIHMLL